MDVNFNSAYLVCSGSKVRKATALLTKQKIQFVLGKVFNINTSDKEEQNFRISRKGNAK
tara:strand:+ start:7378 stop:7554 length:177 start_codon:yes stop_codon:yes gene_type:complete